MERRIIMAVEKATEMSIDEIIHGGRKREIVVARQVAMYMIRMHCGYTLQAIGEMFNVKHATVIHSIKSVTDGLLCNDPHITTMFRKINYWVHHRTDAEKAGANYKRKFFAGMYIANAVSIVLVIYMMTQML